MISILLWLRAMFVCWKASSSRHFVQWRLFVSSHKNVATSACADFFVQGSFDLFFYFYASQGIC